MAKPMLDRRQRRRIVDAIADHRHLPKLQILFDDPDLVLRQEIGVDLSTPACAPIARATRTLSPVIMTPTRLTPIFSGRPPLRAPGRSVSAMAITPSATKVLVQPPAGDNYRGLAQVLQATDFVQGGIQSLDILAVKEARIADPYFHARHEAHLAPHAAAGDRT